jgi:hypothetical protein
MPPHRAFHGSPLGAVAIAGNRLSTDRGGVMVVVVARPARTSGTASANKVD